MTRLSSVLTRHDPAGDYEVEIFDSPNPQRVIVCSHGNGVRRWDGEQFFYAVAEHYTDSAVLLVDQNQPEGDRVRINPLPILVHRINELIGEARSLHSDVPVVLMAHSMGCGVATFAKLGDVRALVFVAPAAGNVQQAMIEKYGANIAQGKTVTTSDGLKKVITADYYTSMKGIIWENEYARLVARYRPIYVFEAGNEEIVGEERFQHRQLPFTHYEIIAGAKHKLTGLPLADFFTKLDPLL